MTQKFNIIFFSEVNSKFGMPIFKMLYHDDRFNIKAFVTTPEGKLCSYYINEDNPVDLERDCKIVCVRMNDSLNLFL